MEEGEEEAGFVGSIMNGSCTGACQTCVRGGKLMEIMLHQTLAVMLFIRLLSSMTCCIYTVRMDGGKTAQRPYSTHVRMAV